MTLDADRWGHPERRAQRLGARLRREPGGNHLHCHGAGDAAAHHRAYGSKPFRIRRCRRAGPGRDVYGNFQVNGIEIEAGAAFSPSKVRSRQGGRLRGRQRQPGQLLPQDRYRATGPRREDGASTRAATTTRLPRQIVFTLDRPLDMAPGANCASVLKHEGTAVGQALGRFRLSITSSPTPNRIVEIPAKLRPILDVAAADRTKKQREDLSAASTGRWRHR